MKLLLLLPLLLLPLSCGNQGETKTSDSNSTSEQTAHPTDSTARKDGPIEGQYAVQCGCEIDGIGACGNYVHVEGHPFEILGDLGLGEMEWCAVAGGAQAQVKGILKEDKFYGESLTVEP